MAKKKLKYSLEDIDRDNFVEALQKYGVIQQGNNIRRELDNTPVRNDNVGNYSPKYVPSLEEVRNKATYNGYLRDSSNDDNYADFSNPSHRPNISDNSLKSIVNRGAYNLGNFTNKLAKSPIGIAAQGSLIGLGGQYALTKPMGFVSDAVLGGAGAMLGSVAGKGIGLATDAAIGNDTKYMTPITTAVGGLGGALYGGLVNRVFANNLMRGDDVAPSLYHIKNSAIDALRLKRYTSGYNHHSDTSHSVNQFVYNNDPKFAPYEVFDGDLAGQEGTFASSRYKHIKPKIFEFPYISQNDYNEHELLSVPKEVYKDITIKNTGAGNYGTMFGHYGKNRVAHDIGGHNIQFGSVNVDGINRPVIRFSDSWKFGQSYSKNARWYPSIVSKYSYLENKHPFSLEKAVKLGTRYIEDMGHPYVARTPWYFVPEKKILNDLEQNTINYTKNAKQKFEPNILSTFNIEDYNIIKNIVNTNYINKRF